MGLKALAHLQLCVLGDVVCAIAWALDVRIVASCIYRPAEQRYIRKTMLCLQFWCTRVEMLFTLSRYPRMVQLHACGTIARGSTVCAKPLHKSTMRALNCCARAGNRCARNAAARFESLVQRFCSTCMVLWHVQNNCAHSSTARMIPLHVQFGYARRTALCALALWNWTRESTCSQCAFRA